MCRYSERHLLPNGLQASLPNDSPLSFLTCEMGTVIIAVPSGHTQSVERSGRMESALQVHADCPEDDFCGASPWPRQALVQCFAVWEQEGLHFGPLGNRLETPLGRVFGAFCVCARSFQKRTNVVSKRNEGLLWALYHHLVKEMNHGATESKRGPGCPRPPGVRGPREPAPVTPPA